MEPPRDISFSRPLDQAFSWTRTVLFDPFRIERWFVLGFAAFLYLLGRGGGGFNCNLPSGPGGGPGGGGGGGGGPFDPAGGSFWTLPVVAVVLAIVLAIALTFIWLSSRATFVFLDGVVRNEARIVEPWGEYRPQANSLFRVSLAVLGVVILVAGSGSLAIWLALRATDTRLSGMSLGAILILATAGVLLWIAFAVFQLVLYDFVVPVMYLRRTTFVPAWREVSALLGGMAGTVALYVLVRFAMGIVVGIATFLSVFVTCCIAAIPYLGEVIRLPLHVVVRSYSLYFLSQLAPDYADFANLGQRPDLASVFE